MGLHIAQPSDPLTPCEYVIAPMRDHKSPYEYRGTSLIKNHPPLGPYNRPMPMAQWALRCEEGSYSRLTDFCITQLLARE